MKCIVTMMVCLALLLSAETPALAQDLPPDSPGAGAVLPGLAGGHSAAFYGIEGATVQQASIRAVLGAAGLDVLERKVGLGGAVALSLVEMFAGGGGSPSDIARPRDDVEKILDAMPD